MFMDLLRLNVENVRYFRFYDFMLGVINVFNLTG